MLTKVGEEGQLLLAFQTWEQRGLHGLLMPKQFAKREVPPLEHAPVDRRPFGKEDVAGVLADGHQRQGVAPDDIAVKDEADRVAALILGAVLEQR